MSCRTLAVVAVLCLAVPQAGADELLYQYVGDVLPYDESAGWAVHDACESVCKEAVEDGGLVLHWDEPGDSINYDYDIARPPDDPPSTLWVEWRFRSNHPLGPNFYSCDAWFTVDYRSVFDLLNMYGDAVIHGSGSFWVSDLAIDEFHTYRFESLNGVDYWFSVDGQIFVVLYGHSFSRYPDLQFAGRGGCEDDRGRVSNEWDSIRFGTISHGEQIVSADPPSGFLDARRHVGLDRFTVTFDSPNYVYVDEIAAQVSAGLAPTVMQTRRRENDGPETVEIVLDRPIAMGETTRFTFDDGVAVNVIEYIFAPGDTDGDGDVDLFDVAVFQNCFQGAASSGPCMACDRDGSRWVRLNDFEMFVDELVGPLGNALNAGRLATEDGRDVGGMANEANPRKANGVARSATPRPTGCELAKLTAWDAASTDYFGRSVGVSGDWAVVGAWQDDDAGSASGSAYVFRRDDNGTPDDPSDDTWLRHAKLTASDAARYDQFGYSVGIDGDLIAVGAWKDDNVVFGAGAVYVFRRDDNGTSENLADDLWIEEAKLLADDPRTGDNLGASVAVSGEYVIVGSYRAYLVRGAAYVFSWTQGEWIQEAKLTASDAKFGDFFGYSVSILERHAIVGAFGNDDDGGESGSAYVFRRDDNGTPADPADDTWIEQVKLTASDAQGSDRFGWSVGISANRAVVGAHRSHLDPTWNLGPGAAYAFERDDQGTPDDPTDDTWVERAKLMASNGVPGDRFGHSVAIDGDYIVVGANLGDTAGVPDSGAAYLFELQGTDWIEVAQLSASDAAWADGFGRSVSISGNQILVGAWADDDAGLSSGAAYLFSTDPDCPARP